MRWSGWESESMGICDYAGTVHRIMKTMTLSAVLNPEADGYVSLFPELDIASEGDTVEEALANLKEALEGFVETASAEEVRTRLRKPALSHFI